MARSFSTPKIPASFGRKCCRTVETQLASPIHRYNYAATDKGTYYTTGKEIDFRDFSTGKVAPVFQMAKTPDLGLEVSPDGRYLLFVQLDYEGSDLKLVENFR